MRIASSIAEGHRLRWPPRSAAVAVAVLAVWALGGCSGQEGSGGADSPRAVIEAHISAMETYDLEAACDLFAPAVRAEMAAWDNSEVDGYCAQATAEVLALAGEAERVRVRHIYREATIVEMEDSQGEGSWFEVRAADGSYEEQLQVVEEGGRWWVAEVVSPHLHDEHGEEPPD